MDKKKPIGKISSSRLFCISAAVVLLIFLPPYLSRELWFDEVLTLQFASLPSLAEIYKSYIIPNNQIVHTWLLHCLLLSGIPPEILRIFPLFCGAAAVWVLWKNFVRELGGKALLLAVAALVISPPFLLYATALRGYMLAALFTVCALSAARRYALGGRISQLGWWLIFSLLAVGVMPSALAGIAAAGLYVLPYCGKKFWKNWKSYRLAAVPFLAFAIFYAPIHSKLLKAFALKEGWQQPWYALLAVGTAVLVTFLIPLIAGVFFHHPRWRDLPRTLIWLLPLGGLLLPTAPFPRVWFVLFPIFALLTAGYMRDLPKKWYMIASVAVVLWGTVMLTEFCRQRISVAVSLAGQDDFYAPRFLHARFTPSETAKQLRHYPVVFVSFDADPYSVAYYRRDIIMDVPPGKLKNLPDHTLIVLAVEEDPARFETRFGGKLYEVYRNGLHRVYNFIR